MDKVKSKPLKKNQDKVKSKPVKSKPVKSKVKSKPVKSKVKSKPVKSKPVKKYQDEVKSKPLKKYQDEVKSKPLKKNQDKCKMCKNYGWWPLGDLVPLGTFDGKELSNRSIKCPWCGAGAKAKGEKYEILVAHKKRLEAIDEHN